VVLVSDRPPDLGIQPCERRHARPPPSGRAAASRPFADDAADRLDPPLADTRGTSRRSRWRRFCRG